MAQSTSKLLTTIGRWVSTGLVSLVAGVITLVILAGAIFHLLYPPERLKELVVEIVNEALLGEVELGQVYLSPLVGLVVRDLRILSSPEFDSEPAVLLDELVLYYDLGELLGAGEVFINVAEAEGLSVNLIEKPGLGWNLEHLVPPSEDEEDDEPFSWESLPVRVRLSKIALREIAVSVRDGISAELDNLNVEMESFDTANPDSFALRLYKEPGLVKLRMGSAEEPTLAGQIEDLSFDIYVQAPLGEIPPTGASGSFNLYAAGINLTAPLAFASAGEFAMELLFDADLGEQEFSLVMNRLALGDYLLTRFTTDVALGEPQPGVKLEVEELNISLAPLVADLSAMLPPLQANGEIGGLLSLSLDLSEELQPERAEFSSTLSFTEVGVEMPVGEDSASLQGLNGSFRLASSIALDGLASEDFNPLFALSPLELGADLSLAEAGFGDYRANGITFALDGVVDPATQSTAGLLLSASAEQVASLSAELPLTLPGFSLDTVVSATPGTGNFDFTGLSFNLADAVSFDGAVQLRGFGQSGLRLTVDELAVELESVLRLVPAGMVVLPTVLPHGRLLLDGFVELPAGALANPEPLLLARGVNTDLTLRLQNCNIGLPGGGVEGLNSELHLALERGSGEIELASTVEAVNYDLPLPMPLSGIRLNLNASLNNLNELQIHELEAGVGSLDFRVGLIGAVSSLLDNPWTALDLSLRLGSIGSPLKVLEQFIEASGMIGLKLSLRGPLQGDEPLRISGGLRFHQLNLRQGPYLAISGLEGELPIEQAVYAEEPLPLPASEDDETSPFGERRYDLFNPLNPPPNLFIKEIRVSDQRIDDLELTWEIANGGLHIWQLGLNALNGRITGEIHLGLTELVPTYRLTLLFGGINVGSLIEGLEVNEESEINGDLRFTGRGFDLIRNFDVEGAVNITKIGSKVVDRLLLFLDPTGSNPSITQVRNLLGGDVYKQPELVQMTLKHQKLTLEIHIVDTGFSFFNLLISSFVDMSEFIIPRIPISGILESIAASP